MAQTLTRACNPEKRRTDYDEPAPIMHDPTAVQLRNGMISDIPPRQNGECTNEDRVADKCLCHKAHHLHHIDPARGIVELVHGIPFVCHEGIQVMMQVECDVQRREDEHCHSCD